MTTIFNPETGETYTDRSIELTRVKSLDSGVLFESGWGFGPAPDRRNQLTVGEEYLVETSRTLQITGMATVRRSPDGAAHSDRWLWRESDQDLARQHAEFVANLNREREEEWRANHDDWERREADLPAPLRRRLSRFRINGGHDFETQGWGYELVVCELAALYATSNGAESDEITAYARLHGTSGNQHGMARMLGLALAAGEIESDDAVANAPSALTPITGDADYSGAER